MKKQIIVVEGDPLLRSRWERTLERLRKLGYGSGCLAEMPKVPGVMLKELIEDRECFVVLGSPGRAKVECSRIYDAMVALGYDYYVCLAADRSTSRYDVGSPPPPTDDGFSAHALLLSAFLASMKYVPRPTEPAALARFDCLPTLERRPSFSPLISTIHARIA